MAPELGLWLRRARENKGVTLEEVEEALRIRSRYLHALEVGDYAALPGPIQVRGFIRNYARFLGLPVEEALARYQAEAEGRPLQPQVKTVQETAERQRVDRPTVFAPPPDERDEMEGQGGLPSGLLWGLIGALAFFLLLTIGTFVYLQIADNQSVAAPTPTPTLAQATLEMTPVPEDNNAPSFSPAVDGTITLRLEPEQHAWIRVTADEEIVFQGVAEVGQTINATATERCMVETGNGGAFHLYVNGNDFGKLGEQGEVVQRAWTPTGEVSNEGL
jgi:cytoskeletal protein RodZ